MNLIRICSLLAALLFVHAGHAAKLTDSQQTAQRLVAEAYAGAGKELLCGCEFTNGAVEGRCPALANNASSAAAVRFVPVVTAAEYGRKRECWRIHEKQFATKLILGQRDKQQAVQSDPLFSCDVTDPVYRQMSADPHNLIPAVQTMAWKRGHRKAADLAEGSEAMEGCGLQVSATGEGHLFEPPASSKGNIARIYLYFTDRYALQIEPQRRRLFEQWSTEDPVDEFERRSHDVLMAKTKTCNPYITQTSEKCW